MTEGIIMSRQQMAAQRKDKENPRELFLNSWKYRNADQDFTVGDVLHIINRKRKIEGVDPYHRSTAVNLVRRLKDEGWIVPTSGEKYTSCADNSGLIKRPWVTITRKEKKKYPFLMYPPQKDYRRGGE